MSKDLIKAIESSEKARASLSRKAVTKYSTTLQNINTELRRVIKRKEEAATNVQELKDRLGITSIDVLTVEDEKKKIDFLGKRKRLKEQLEDEELYLEMNVEAYRKKLYEDANLDQLKREAYQEELDNQKVYNEHKDLLKSYMEKVEQDRRSMFGMNNVYEQTVRQHDHHKSKINDYERVFNNPNAKFVNGVWTTQNTR